MPHKCKNPRCSQHPDLYQTGWSAKQGPTHHCRVCGWGYWTHIVKPTAEQVAEAEKLYPKFTKEALIEALTREVPRPKPEGELYKDAEKKMIEQLGGPDSPYWLQKHKKRYWRAKYIELYPNSDLAKKAKQDQWDKENK